MNFKTLAIPALAAVMVAAPFTAAPANAHDGFWHGRGFSHGGPGPVLGIIGGVLIGAAAIASLPFQAIAAEPVAVAPPPPPQPYYVPQAAYYPPQPQVVYAQPAYYPAPVYYAPRPVVYGRGYYYR